MKAVETDRRALVIGACGQVGTELTLALAAQRGHDAVLATDYRAPNAWIAGVPFERLDVRDKAATESLLLDERIEEVYHMAAWLSARGEEDPMRTWELNVQASLSLLEIIRERRLSVRLFFPSSIAVFGPDAPKRDCPQYGSLCPRTMYGITKLSVEHLLAYYHRRYGMDTRSLRFPGIISAKHPPGGGTTDYAVEIFEACLRRLPYCCFLSADTRLPMMHISDAIRATLELMAAPRGEISVAESYNLTAMSFTPAELATAIRRHEPQLQVYYVPDARQTIATTWPETIDDSCARKDWGWQHRQALSELVSNMLAETRERLKEQLHESKKGDS